MFQLAIWLDAIIGVIIYFLCTIMWLNLVLALKNMSTKKTAEYKIVLHIYIITTSIFSIGALVLTVLTLQRNRIVYVLLAIWVSVPVFASGIYGLSQVIFLRRELAKSTIDDKVIEFVKSKNWLLAIISFIYFIGIGLMGAVLFNEDAFDPWYYLGFNFILRVLEIIIYYMFFFWMQQFVGELFCMTSSKYLTKPGTRLTRSVGANLTKNDGHLEQATS